MNSQNPLTIQQSSTQELMERQDSNSLSPQAANALSGIFDPNYLMALDKFVEKIKDSQFIPQVYRGKPGDLFIALDIANHMRINWLQVLQNMYVVHGQPGWSAKFIIAQANAMKAFKTRVEFREETKGEIIVPRKINDKWVDSKVHNLAVTAYATNRSDKEISFTVSMEMAKQEGWTSNPKYHSLPQLMLSYRAAAFLIRLHAPEVLFGYSTVEELEDIAAVKGAGPGNVIEGIGTVTDDDITNNLTKQAQRLSDPAVIRDQIASAMRAATALDELDEIQVAAQSQFQGQQLAGLTKIANTQRERLRAEANPIQVVSGQGAEDKPAPAPVQQAKPAAAPPTSPQPTGLDPGFTAGMEGLGEREPGSDDDLGDLAGEAEFESQGDMHATADATRDSLINAAKTVKNPAELANLKIRNQRVLGGFPQQQAAVNTAIAIRAREFRMAEGGGQR